MIIIVYNREFSCMHWCRHGAHGAKVRTCCCSVVVMVTSPSAMLACSLSTLSRFQGSCWLTEVFLIYFMGNVSCLYADYMGKCLVGRMHPELSCGFISRCEFVCFMQKSFLGEIFWNCVVLRNACLLYVFVKTSTSKQSHNFFYQECHILDEALVQTWVNYWQWFTH